MQAHLSIRGTEACRKAAQTRAAYHRAVYRALQAIFLALASSATISLHIPIIPPYEKRSFFEIPLDRPDGLHFSAIGLCPRRCLRAQRNGGRLGAILVVLAEYYLQTLLGGLAGAVAGIPILSALLNPDRWLLWLGILFVLIVTFFPKGIVGSLRARAAAPIAGSRQG